MHIAKKEEINPTAILLLSEMFFACSLLQQCFPPPASKSENSGYIMLLSSHISINLLIHLFLLLLPLLSLPLYLSLSLEGDDATDGAAAADA